MLKSLTEKNHGTLPLKTTSQLKKIKQTKENNHIVDPHSSTVPILGLEKFQAGDKIWQVLSQVVNADVTAFELLVQSGIPGSAGAGTGRGTGRGAAPPVVPAAPPVALPVPSSGWAFGSCGLSVIALQQ
jgi:hypothetical protein